MRTGHAVNLYLSDETLKKLEAIIQNRIDNAGAIPRSKSQEITWLIEEKYNEIKEEE